MKKVMYLGEFDENSALKAGQEIPWTFQGSCKSFFVDGARWQFDTLKYNFGIYANRIKDLESKLSAAEDESYNLAIKFTAAEAELADANERLNYERYDELKAQGKI